MKKLPEMKPGACFPMGKDASLWRILKINTEQQTVLVIAASEICYRSYHTKDKDITWPECSLRTWLNKEFFEDNFSEEEKEAIIECEITAGDGENTKDRVWLLSTDEAGKYFKDDEDRKAGRWWWLRSPGCNRRHTAYVGSYGGIRVYGYYVYYMGGVRPAVLLDLNSDFLQSLFHASGEIVIQNSRRTAENGTRLPAESSAAKRTRPLFSAEKPEAGTCFPMGKDGTLWKVLEINAEQQTALVIADMEIGWKAYSTENKNVTWSECSLRKWLNGTYYEKTFSEAEKEAIIECKTVNPGNAGYDTGGGEDTKDRIRLLSIDEAKKYFENEEDRSTGSSWWLRSPGYDQRSAAFVESRGGIDTFGDDVDGGCGVRPVFLLNLHSAFCRSLFSSSPDGGTVIKNSKRIIKNGFLPSAGFSAGEGTLSLPAGYVPEKLVPGRCFPMGKNDTWWRVLEVNAWQQTALVIADAEICCKAYDEGNKAVTWTGCTLRNWLNGTYYEKTFSEEEKEAIIECETVNPGNAKYGTGGGENTKDRIRLLSIDEAEKYFKDEEDRATGNCWWLRSPGIVQMYAADVSPNGVIDDNGRDASDTYGVRPAFLLDLNSVFSRSLFSVNQNGETVIRRPGLIIKNRILFSADPSVTKAVLPSSVKKIASGAFRNCRNLFRINWETDSMRIDPDAFGDVSLRLPAEFYLGDKLPRAEFARLIPDHPKVLANLLILSHDTDDGYADDEWNEDRNGLYRKAALEKLTSENAEAVAKEMLAAAGSGGELCFSHKRNIMRFLMNSHRDLSPETIRGLCGFLHPYIPEFVDMAGKNGETEIKMLLLQYQQEHPSSKADKLTIDFL